MMHDGNWMVLDIETRPDPAMDTPEWWERQAASLEAPANYKDPVKIEAYRAERLASARGKMALSPLTGIVACVGWQARDAEAPSVLTVQEPTRQGEAALLQEWAQKLWALDRSRIVGWNVREFDIPFLIARCALHQIRLPWFWMPRDYRNVVDLLSDFRMDGKLSEWMYAMGGSFKEVEGADLLLLPLPELAEHCRKDVGEEMALAAATEWLWGNRYGS